MQNYDIPKKSAELTAREKLQELNKQSKTEFENSLLKENLMEYTALFERLKKEQNDFLEQAEKKLESDREQNRQSVRNWQENSEKRLNELNSSVSSLKDSNRTLSDKIEVTLTALKDDIKAECSQEIKNALQGNLTALQSNISEYEKNISSCISKTDIQMKKFNTKMEMHLNDFEQKKRQFFKFDNAKTFFFWASQAVSFGTFGFLVYFLFFRG